MTIDFSSIDINRTIPKKYESAARYYRMKSSRIAQEDGY